MSQRYPILSFLPELGLLSLVAACTGPAEEFVPPTATDSQPVVSDPRPAAAARQGLMQIAYIKASNTGPEDTFGSRLALNGDGNTLAAGAQLEDSGALGIDGDQDDDTATNAGAVYLFTRDGETWSQRAYVKASNTEAFDEFGSSLSLSRDGSLLAVGAQFEDSAGQGVDADRADNDVFDSGAVYLFER